MLTPPPNSGVVWSIRERSQPCPYGPSKGGRPLCREPVRLEDGYLWVPAGPGSGVEVGEQVVQNYRIA